MPAGDLNTESASRLGAATREAADAEVNNNVPSKQEAAAAPPKYSLRARSVKKRIETEHRQAEPKVRQPRAKARPAPLSKYRRKTANARERDRMKDINTAFDMLERSIPDLALRSHAEKVTKITVLRLAIRYIGAMTELLASDGVGPTEATAGDAELPDLDAIEGLTDFQLPDGLDELLDIRSDSDGLDFDCSDFSGLPSP